MVPRGIASILHRDTIAVIVGARTFERGEQCFSGKRVLQVEAARGELRGTVQPAEHGRANYACRIWMRDEGVAYARALEAAGVEVTLREYGDMSHGFIRWGGVVDRTRELIGELGAYARAALRA